MISAWTMWRISTAIDKGRPLSPALARRVRRDPECRRFYEASLAAAERLRQDAPEIVRAERLRLTQQEPLLVPAPGAIRSSRAVRSFRPVWATAAAVLVIGLALGATVWWWPAPREPQPPTAMQRSDVAELAQVIREIKHNVDKVRAREGTPWKERVARSGEALRAPIVREAQNMAADTRHILQAFSSMIRSGSQPQPSAPDDDSPAPSSDRRTPLSPPTASLVCCAAAVKVPL